VDIFDPRKFGDKIARLIAVQHMFSEGLVYVPWPIDEETGQEAPFGYKWVEDAMDQIGTFPKAPHDDFVDSATQALRWLRDSGILLRSEEHAADVEAEFRYNSRLTPLYPV
jgi:predicted phage terminase large subunit-like protein